MKHAREDYDRIQDPAGLIPANEPVFLIRGQDLAAIATLRFYAQEASKNGASDELTLKVLQHANEMAAWQRTVARKTPDLK
jgi:hypothetical protein